MKALEAERAGLLRDVALKEEMEQQYAKRGTLQACCAASCLHACPSVWDAALCMARAWRSARPPLHRLHLLASLLHALPHSSLQPRPAHPLTTRLVFHPQAREIRTAHTKISSLEKGMVRMAASFEAEKAALEQGLRQQLADATAEQASLRRCGGQAGGRGLCGWLAWRDEGRPAREGS